MARRKAKAELKGPFVPHSLEMLTSPAWRAMKINDRRVLDRLEIEHLSHGGARNGRLVCTFNDFIDAGVGARRGVAEAIRRLETLGFIEVKRNGWNGTPNRAAPNIYRLTYVLGRAEQTTGAYHPPVEPTNEWRRFKDTDAVDAALRRTSTARTRCAVPLPPRDIDSGSFEPPPMRSPADTREGAQ